MDRWPDSFKRGGDEQGYYVHVVSALLYGDIGDYSKSYQGLLNEDPDAFDLRKDKFGIRKTTTGKSYVKYTLGTAVMEAPFFLIAHSYTLLTQSNQANGWSTPYHFIVSLSPMVYVLLGIWLLYGLLNQYFDQRTTILSLLSLTLATNLFYHASYTVMAHSMLFFNFSLLLWLTHKFYKAPTSWLGFFIGGSVGLITICRIPEVIAVLIPILFGVNSLQNLKQRINFIRQHYRKLLWAFMGFLIPLSLQITYWYYVSGQLVFNPYEGEGFDFLSPQIINGWFSFKNGWLIYTPIMIFGLLGLFARNKSWRDFMLPTVIYTSLHSYIHYAYYAWTYFPGLGQRPMVETYPLLVFGLAGFYNLLFKKPKWKWIPYLIFAICSILNIFQTWQMKEGIIWSERGSKSFYVETFGKTQGTLSSLRAFESETTQPNESKLSVKEVLAERAFNKESSNKISNDISLDGSPSLIVHKEKQIELLNIPVNQINKGDWIKYGINAYVEDDQLEGNKDAFADLVVEILDKNNTFIMRKSIKITPFIGNKTFSIWHKGTPNQWGEASSFFKFRKSPSPDLKIRLSIFNEFNQKIYVDNAYLKSYTY